MFSKSQLKRHTKVCIVFHILPLWETPFPKTVAYKRRTMKEMFRFFPWKRQISPSILIILILFANRHFKHKQAFHVVKHFFKTLVRSCFVGILLKWTLLKDDLLDQVNNGSQNKFLINKKNQQLDDYKQVNSSGNNFQKGGKLPLNYSTSWRPGKQTSLLKWQVK